MCLSASHEQKYSYLVKILNPEQKSKFMTKICHNVRDRFDSPKSLKEKLVATFKDKLPSVSSLDIGYFERRGSAKRWIEDQADLDAMYRTFSVGEEITLWVHGCLPRNMWQRVERNVKGMQAKTLVCQVSKPTKRLRSIQ